jgi:hypothetical protein
MTIYRNSRVTGRAKSKLKNVGKIGTVVDINLRNNVKYLSIIWDGEELEEEVKAENIIEIKTENFEQRKDTSVSESFLHTHKMNKILKQAKLFDNVEFHPSMILQDDDLWLVNSNLPPKLSHADSCLIQENKLLYDEIYEGKRKRKGVYPLHKYSTEMDISSMRINERSLRSRALTELQMAVLHGPDGFKKPNTVIRRTYGQNREFSQGGIHRTFGEPHETNIPGEFEFPPLVEDGEIVR